jgi:hypothetical protein
MRAMHGFEQLDGQAADARSLLLWLLLRRRGSGRRGSRESCHCCTWRVAEVSHRGEMICLDLPQPSSQAFKPWTLGHRPFIAHKRNAAHKPPIDAMISSRSIASRPVAQLAAPAPRALPSRSAVVLRATSEEKVGTTQMP